MAEAIKKINKRGKKTNFQRLYRNSRKSEIAAFNYALEVEKLATQAIEKNWPLIVFTGKLDKLKTERAVGK